MIFAYFAVFILASSYQDGLLALALVPGEVAARPWSLLTYAFIPRQGMFWFFISMLVLWIMARPLEEEWGSPRFLAFWLVAVLGAAAMALVLGKALIGDVGFQASLLFTFATLYPETEFRLFFVLPVKVKYIAVVGGAFLLLTSFAYGLLGGIANVVGGSAGYLFFLATRRLPSRRKVAFEIKKRRADLVAKVQDASVETRNRGWDPKVRAAESRVREAGRVVGRRRAPARRARPPAGSLDHRLRPGRFRLCRRPGVPGLRRLPRVRRPPHPHGRRSRSFVEGDSRPRVGDELGSCPDTRAGLPHPGRRHGLGCARCSEPQSSEPPREQRR